MYTAMCTQPAVSPPVGYKHQGRQAILHQSDGGKLGIDRLQREAPLRVWSEIHRRPNKPAKEGGESQSFRNTLRATKRSGGGVLDFPPEEVRPGGHIGEEDPFCRFVNIKTDFIFVFYSRISVRVNRFGYD